jgi:hypothetical protein
MGKRGLEVANYRQLKALAKRADCAKGKERKRLVETLLKALPTLDPFEGFSEQAIWLAKFLARLKWFDAEEFSYAIEALD